MSDRVTHFAPPRADRMTSSAGEAPKSERPASEEQLAARQLQRIEENSRVRGGALDVDLGDWDFVCECGAADCNERVTLTPLLYEELRAAGELVLAERHVLQRAEQAIVWARELAEEAAALRAEARHLRKHVQARRR